MRLRSRVLVALVALIAFSASVAEGLWASSCAGTERGGTMTDMGMSMPAGESHLPDSSGEPEQRSGEERCPLPVLLGAGCLVTSLPARNTQLDLADGEIRDTLLPSVTLVDRIAVTGLFRPPQR